MDIMDDVLDLMDSLGETLEKGKRTAKHLLRGQSGFSTLVAVLVIMAVGAVVITPLLAFVVTGQRAGTVHKETTHRFYAADAGIQDGKWKVTSGNLPLWMKADWDESVYAHATDNATLYQLPAQVNGNDVTVKIQAMWLLEGLETPSTDQHRTPDPDLAIVSNILGGGQMQIVIICNTPTATSLDRIGVWIPKTASYVSNSSNLGSLGPVVTQSDFRNGRIITFDFSTAVSFSSLPGGTGNRRVITFNYTPSNAIMDTSWSWCRTTGTDPKLAWSDDIKLYQVESTATNPSTGQSTTVISQTMTNESIGTYLAYYGDYAVTGNALMRETDDDKVRDHLYEESPGEISAVPGSGTARKIILYWSGWKADPWDPWYGNTSKDVSTWPAGDQEALHALADTCKVNEVSVRVEYKGNNYDLGTVTAEEWTVLPNGSSGSPNGWSYGCNYDITSKVLDALPADFVGNATYWVGHAYTPSTMTAFPSSQDMNGIWGSSASNIFMVGGSGNILKYNGTSWSLQSAPSSYTQTLRGVWGSSATDVWAVGDRRTSGGNNYYTLWHTTNGGTSWSAYSMSSAQNLNGIWGYNSSNIWAVGASGRILKYDGSTWSLQSAPSSYTQTLRGVWGSSATDVWAVGDRRSTGGGNYNYTLWHTTNGGTSWSAITKTSGQNLNGIWGYDSSHVFAVGASGTILKYDGSNWTAQTSGITDTLYAVWGTSATDVYAVGSGGIILHTTDGGTTWSAMTTIGQDLYAVWGTSSSNIYAAGAKGALVSYLMHWDGSEWTRVSASVTDLYGWVNGHSGESFSTDTNYSLSDVVDNEWANACWSVVTLYTSPVTLAHQMYLFNTFRYWNSNDDVTFTLEGFLAPAGIASEDEAVRLTYFVGEGDQWYYNGDNIYLNGYQLNPSYITPASCAPTNNAMNSAGNSGGVTGYAPDDGIDLDTYVIDGSDHIINPADSSATVELETGTDIWNMVYMILSFRSDKVGSGLVTYIVE